MERGWDAAGLLAPLWSRVGGRDALAARAGIKPAGTLSAYNSGKRRLGIKNARLLADALGLTIFDLGAPAEAGLRPEDRAVLDRLADLEAALNRLGPNLEEVGERVTALEQRVPPKKRRGGSSG